MERCGGRKTTYPFDHDVLFGLTRHSMKDLERPLPLQELHAHKGVWLWDARREKGGKEERREKKTSGKSVFVA